ncbi:MAG: arginine--tRNA ligase [Candidatus Njordarchaeia archaeon]
MKKVNKNNVIGEIRASILELVRNAVKHVYKLDIEPKIEKPPKPEFGDLSVPIGFQLAKMLEKDKKKRKEIASKAAEEIKRFIKTEETFIKKIEIMGGYLNFFIDFDTFAERVITSAIEMGEKYGSSNVGKGETIIVEHTSANPIHPLHIGTARNSILGDSLARLMRFVNYNVITRFYVDDVGRQVAYLVYAIRKIGWQPVGKIDHWLGVLYSCANSIAKNQENGKKIGKIVESLGNLIQEILEFVEKSNIENLKQYRVTLLAMKEKLDKLTTVDWRTILNDFREIINSMKEELQENEKEALTEMNKILGGSEENLGFNQLIREIEEINEWADIEKELKNKWGDTYYKLLSKIGGENIEEKVSELIKQYEYGEPSVKDDFKKICKAALEGFQQTLGKLDITFDGFDWESDLIWSGAVDNIIRELSKLGWAVKESDSGSTFLDLQKAALKEEYVRKIFGIQLEQLEKAKKEGKLEDALPPNLTLTRSDGTTLYPTRDIAYSIYKSKKFSAKKVFNVIGVDQSLTQKQIKAALYLAGYKEIADNQIHIPYEMVTLPNIKLSSRRGIYVTLDELYIDTLKRVHLIKVEREGEKTQNDSKGELEKIAAGAIRYALISISPTKKIIFDWSRVLDFEQNSGPFLQYAYVRAYNVLEKANWEIPDKANFSALKEDVEKELVWKIAEFPEMVSEAVKLYRPDLIAEYANKLSMIFNSFYQRYRILQAENSELRNARLLLTEAFRITLGNAMEILGIPKLKRM